MRRLAPILLLVALTSTGAVSPAAAASRDDIIADCSDDGRLQGDYKPSEVRDARKNLPSDVAEYTDCADVLRRAELPDGGSTVSPPPGGTPLGGGTVPPTTAGGVTTTPLVPTTEADRQALTDARDAGSQPVTVGGQKLLPSASDIRDGYRASGLPASLVVALIALGLAGLALSVPPIRRKLPFWRKPLT